MTRVVNTKSELKQAVIDEVDTIVINPQMMSADVKALIKVLQLSPIQRGLIITFLGGSGALIVASVAAAPATMGMSTLVSSAAVISTAIAAETSVATIAALIILAAAVGVSIIISLLRTYDVKEDDFDFSVGLKGGVKLHRKVKYKERE